MLKLIRYMFYLGYKPAHKMGRKDPTYLLGLIGMPLILNGLTISNILSIISQVRNNDVTISDKIYAIIFAILLFYFLIRYLANKDKILSIFKEFGRKTKMQKWIWNILVISYLIYMYSLDKVKELF